MGIGSLSLSLLGYSHNSNTGKLFKHELECMGKGDNGGWQWVARGNIQSTTR